MHYLVISLVLLSLPALTAASTPTFAQHTKGHEHNDETGLLTAKGKKQYDRLAHAALNGDQKFLRHVPLNPQSQRHYVYLETLGEYREPLNKIPPFPTLLSKEAGAQLAEVYLLALARDVFFDVYGTGKGADRDIDNSSITNKALAILNGYGTAYKGPLNKDKKADPQRLFRGNYAGSEIGPYISQFLYVPLCVPAGNLPTDIGFENIPPSVFQVEQLQPIPGKRNFGITHKDYCALQNGLIPQPYSKNDFSLEKRYISTGRDLASYVHILLPTYILIRPTLLSLMRCKFFLGTDLNPLLELI